MPKEKQEEQDTLGLIIEAIDATESDPDRHLSIQIDKSLRDAVVAAQTSNQPAEVTFKVKVKPGADRRVSFSANVAAKLPRPPVSAITLYADSEGNVLRADPRQTRLPFTQPQSTTKEN